jgi:hypothetical protein
VEAGSFAGQVLAVFSRRAAAFQPPPGQTGTFVEAIFRRGGDRVPASRENRSLKSLGLTVAVLWALSILALTVISVVLLLSKVSASRPAQAWIAVPAGLLIGAGVVALGALASRVRGSASFSLAPSRHAYLRVRPDSSRPRRRVTRAHRSAIRWIAMVAVLAAGLAGDILILVIFHDVSNVVVIFTVSHLTIIIALVAWRALVNRHEE